MKIISGFLFVALLFNVLSVQAQLPAFPGAEGGGMYTTGGRGGLVYTVNTLQDNNTGNSSTREGSLRWCINQKGARTIVFKVAGRIQLTSQLRISNGNLTIAGQTAPGDGICLSGYDVTVNASNVIIRYMRFRMGDVNNVQSDALWGRYQKNVIIDHCSMSWSVDECSSFYENEDFTMQWCILSESLRFSKHDKGGHGYGGIWGGKNATFHHNLLAHHDSRNPRFASYNQTSNRADGLVDYRNNVVYNWGGNSGYGGEGGRYNFINNYYQPGASSSRSTQFVAPDPDGTIDPATGLPTGIHGVFYVVGNLMMNPNGTINTSVSSNNWNGVVPNPKIPNGKVATRSDTPYSCLHVSTHTAQNAYHKVLAYVGASLQRDPTDERVINEVRNRLAPVRASGGGGTRAGLIDTQEDVGGWDSYSYSPADVVADSDFDGMPDEWETARGLNPYSASDGNKVNDEGYTNLEIYLNSLVETTTNGQVTDVINSTPSVSFSNAQHTDQLRVFYDRESRQLTINAVDLIESVQVYTILGQLVAMKRCNTSHLLLDVPHRHPMLIVKATLSDKGVSTAKVLL